MQINETTAELVEPMDQTGYPMDPNPDPRSQEYFSKENNLQVIQEYNREENMPRDTKLNFWALASKSIKLGFWNEKDEYDIYLHKNLIKIGYLMTRPRHRYTFKDRFQMMQIDMLVYSDFKRGVGMEKYKLNERTLQATSVTQNIQGGSAGKRGGFLSGLKSFFG